MTLFSWQIEFARPLWFAALFALPLLGIFWWRSLVRDSPLRKGLSLLLRSIMVLLLAAGLGGLQAIFPRQSQPILVCNFPEENHESVPPAIEIRAPVPIRACEPFSFDVLLRAKSAGTAIVELLCDSQSVQKDTVRLTAGENHVDFPAIVLKPSRVVYSIRVLDERGGWPNANGSDCALYVDPPPRILVVESQPAWAEHLVKALTNEKVEVEVKPELPAAAEQLAAYDLIMLGNVSAAALGEPRMKALQSYVHDARGGLIVVGGDRSFTVGGYRHTPLEEILPVISEERKSKPKPTLAMVLVLDISGSMNDPSANAKLRNIDLAKEALRTAVKMLGPQDQVGVLVFEDRSRWIWPLAPVTDQEKIIARINTIEARGSTNMYPPLEQAFLSLREAYADLKHIIVTTDGLGEPGDFDGLARKMAAAGITMTTVGVGSEPARPFLQSIADKAKGRAYFCPDAENVPRIFQTDTGVVTKIGITEEPFFPKVVDPGQVLQGLDMSRAPSLLGYVETKARPEANVVLASPTGEPILAFWRYGGGTVATFTSDIQSRWAAPWLTWPGFSKFWVQLVRQVVRHDLPNTSRLDVRAADGRLHFALDAIDREGHFINGADVSLIVTNGNAKSAQEKLTQIAPGRYAGTQTAGQGGYWFTGEIKRDGRSIGKFRSGAVVRNMPATQTEPEGDIKREEREFPKSLLLWPWLFGAGVILLVGDLAVRRTGRPV
jgi:Ca-activated chloride channel homolog